MYETEARHYLREVLMAAIHRADEGCADWRIADALLDAGEITWNYQIRPEPQVATFQLIFTGTDAEPASGGVAEPSGPLTAEEATPDCVVPPTPDHDRVRSLQRALGGLAADGPIVLAGEIPALPETLTVHLDNRDARFVPADPPVPLFEGDEALPPEPGTCPFCGVHGTVRTVHLGEPSPPEGEALGVTDEHRHDFGKAIGDLRDRYGPRRQHDPGALIEEPDLYRPHAALNERGHLRGCGCEDCERDEQGEGDDRG